MELIWNYIMTMMIIITIIIRNVSMVVRRADEKTRNSTEWRQNSKYCVDDTERIGRMKQSENRAKHAEKAAILADPVVLSKILSLSRHRFVQVRCTVCNVLTLLSK